MEIDKNLVIIRKVTNLIWSKLANFSLLGNLVKLRKLVTIREFGHHWINLSQLGNWAKIGKFAQIKYVGQQ